MRQPGQSRMVNHIRAIEMALGDGVKRVYDSELDTLQRVFFCRV